MVCYKCKVKEDKIMTFNDVLGLVIALEDLGFEVTKTGFSYKKGIRT